MRLLALLLLALMLPAAQATCLFAKDTPPQGWYEWAAVLVAGDVTQVEQRGDIDVVSLAVSDTFKGPANVKTATLDVPAKLWGVCKIARPAIGDHVLGALNANNDPLLVPLSEPYAERLRATQRK
ncbi:MAG: hypothetical protein JF611_00560 [Betaproteobacteria bacterium]|nr:hypothetical protein [Betaproteobacteria bacterium]